MIEHPKLGTDFSGDDTVLMSAGTYRQVEVMHSEGWRHDKYICVQNVRIRYGSVQLF